MEMGSLLQNWAKKRLDRTLKTIPTTILRPIKKIKIKKPNIQSLIKFEKDRAGKKWEINIFPKCKLWRTIFTNSLYSWMLTQKRRWLLASASALFVKATLHLLQQLWRVSHHQFHRPLRVLQQADRRLVTFPLNVLNGGNGQNSYCFNKEVSKNRPFWVSAQKVSLQFKQIYVYLKNYEKVV